MLTIRPLTPANWQDFASLCAAMGSNRSCWCMWWRDDGVRSGGPARNRAHTLVGQSSRPVGLIAYVGSDPVGWVAVGPRSDYPRLNRGRDTAPVDDNPDTWVIPCFFVREEYRGQGVATALLDGAVNHAGEQGALVVEGIPSDPATRRRSPTASYTGVTGMFERAGFVECARRTPKGRVLMRKELQ